MRLYWNQTVVSLKLSVKTDLSFKKVSFLKITYYFNYILHFQGLTMTFYLVVGAFLCFSATFKTTAEPLQKLIPLELKLLSPDDKQMSQKIIDKIYNHVDSEQLSKLPKHQWQDDGKEDGFMNYIKRQLEELQTANDRQMYYIPYQQTGKFDGWGG